MSSASSPARSSAASSGRSPLSPTRNASPQQLTPRSKIRAMLAAIDDESYQEQSPAVRKSTTTPEGAQDHADRRSSSISPRSNTESDGSTDEPIQARGRLAARLQYTSRTGDTPEISPTATEEDNREEAENGKAYNRIRRQLLSKSQTVEDSQNQNSQERQFVDEEDDGPIISRRRQAVLRDGPSLPQSPSLTPTRRHRSSPGLFLTPGVPSENDALSKPSVNDDSDSDLPADPQRNERFLALVARAKAERKAKEDAEAKTRAVRVAEHKQQVKKGTSRRSATPLGDSEGDSDDAGARKLTQQARPTRKASKKALEEMNRETQRMNRNMQLAHQARTKKKITKESFFARFNFRTSNELPEKAPQAQSSSTVASSAPASETECVHRHETPPSSPTAPLQSPKLQDVLEPATEQDMDLAHTPHADDELPSFEDIMREPKSVLDKGKGKAIESVVENAPPMLGEPKKPRSIADKPPVRLRFSKGPARVRKQHEESDSELEILPARRSRPSKLDVFSRLPEGKQSEARSLQTLRALAHLNSPGKGSGKSRASMTPSEMQTSLQQRARQQAAAERAEKLQDLKDRGIIVQTTEERQRDQAEVDDLVEKARQEAADVKKKEKDAAKRAAKRNGEEFNESSDDDEEYQANEADESDMVLSGSEEENALAEGLDEEIDAEVDEEGGVVLDDARKQTNGLFEDEAMEDVEAEDASGDEVASDQGDMAQPLYKKSRVNRVIESDDEDFDNTEPTLNLSPVLETPQKPMIPAIALGTSPGLMGMTQAFAATLAGSQTQANEDLEVNDEQDSMAFLGAVPEPNVPIFDANDSESMVMDSQADSSIPPDTNASGINLEFIQSQIEDELSRDTQYLPQATQDFEIPEPTQDMGFHLSSPAGNRFISAPSSTIDTVLIPEESPIKKKKGRLQRRQKDVSSQCEGESGLDSPQDSPNPDTSANAFDVMKGRRKAAAIASAFDKKKSNAKDMVEEQAQESEDEYAGLGGASDDESAGEEDEDLKKMIEEGDVEVDERKLAAYYADKERASDEQAISKLYKDISNGALRRKRGADIDLSDSDDDAEARQRVKRREFAKMRKAMLTDEKLAKVAENPKKLAFLRAVEDREDEEDLGIGWDILGAREENENNEQSTQEVADSQDKTANAEQSVGSKRKRPLQESLPDAANRPPPAARRTKTKKPATLAEIRESVSFLIETPESMSFQPHAESSDIEEDGENQTTAMDTQDVNEVENENGKDLMPPPPLPTHNNPRRTSAPIIDRLSLKRASTVDQSNNTRLAFAAPNTSGSNSTFRVPSLLRRASTSNLANKADNHGITTLAATEQAAGGGGGKGSYVKTGGRKGSSILGQAREMERRAVLDGAEKRRQEERERIAKCRREGFLVGTGQWEK